MGLPSESEQLKEEECADSCADIGDEWVLDYMVQAHSRGGSGSDPPTEPFIQIPAIYILIHILLPAGHPAESCLQGAPSLGGRRNTEF